MCKSPANVVLSEGSTLPPQCFSSPSDATASESLLGADDARLVAAQIVFVTESWLRSMPLVELLILPRPSHSPVMRCLLMDF